MIRTINFNLSQSSIEFLRNDWHNYIKKIPKYPVGKFNGKGVVFTAGGVSYISCLWVSINSLRDSGCELPIEVWYLGNEISIDMMKCFSDLHVDFRDFNEIETTYHVGYHLKPLAILHSRFKEVLFMDADNICVGNPETLFKVEEYMRTGTIFWPDYWYTDRSNPIWEIIESNAFETKEQESGQILINKEVCWRELNLCSYFNKMGKYYYKFLYGDKDTFKFSWQALKTEYFMIRKGPSSCGISVDKIFYGNTMIQYDDKSQIAFLHRNLMKWDVTLLHERFWREIKSFKEDASNQKVLLKNNRGVGSIDLAGDTTLNYVSNEIVNLETRCLGYLEKLRNYPEYLKFFEYMHFVNKGKSLVKHF